VQATGNQNTAFGFNAGTDISTGDRNTCIGFEAGKVIDTGSSNTFIGFAAGDASTGSSGNNTCVGDAAGSAINSGSENTCIGQGAGASITTASGNTAIGRESLLSANVEQNTAIGYGASIYMSGDSNTSVGYNSLIGNTSSASNATGTHNTVVGHSAMGLGNVTTASENVVMGRLAMYATVSGTRSVAIGFNAIGNQALSAQGNVGVGYQAGADYSSGEHNVGIGYEANANFTTGSYNIGIGSQALFGNSSSNGTGSDNIGIGRVAGSLITSGSDNIMIGRTAMQGITSGDNNISIGLNSGLSGSPGGAQTTGDNKIFLGDSNISQFNCQVSLTAASDQRDKTDFKDLDLGLNFINSLKPYTFKWDKRINYVDKTKEDWSKDLDLDKINNDGTHKEDWLDIGFKAQEVEVLEKAAGYEISKNTNLTTTLSEDSKQYGLKYEKFVPILVKAIQELSAKNDALEARIKTLEG
jgi:hypothetical protein